MQDDQPVSTRAFKGIRYEMYDSPASGRQEIRWLGEPDPEVWQLPFYSSHPTLTLRRPEAYWVPSYRTDIIERQDPSIEALLEDFNRVGAAINLAYFEEE